MVNTPEQKGPFSRTALMSRIALWSTLVFLIFVVIASVAWAIVSFFDAQQSGQWDIALMLPVLAFVAALVAGAWAVVLHGAVQVLIADEAAMRNTAGWLERIETLHNDQSQSLKKLVELESLSDQAKSLIFRDREIDALRETVRDDIMRQDYKTAETLIETMETRFGYADEATRLRQEVQDARKATLEEKIDTAIGRVQAIIDAHDWPRAIRAAQKLLGLFPTDAKVAALPQRVEAARARHKRQLLQEYGEAVKRNDVDRSIELLRELDPHLTPQEAAALEESARGVFRAKLHNLGVQFAICVTDQRWDEAIITGEEIVRNYPNSRMSHEVRQKMPQLRSRAAEVQAPRR